MKKPRRLFFGGFLEAPPGIEPGMKVLQTSALPLGYDAVSPLLQRRGLLYYECFKKSRRKISAQLKFEKMKECEKPGGRPCHAQKKRL